MEVLIKGCRIQYKETGSGDNTVVILQGWGTSMGIYDGMAASINSANACIYSSLLVNISDVANDIVNSVVIGCSALLGYIQQAFLKVSGFVFLLIGLKLIFVTPFV